MSIFTDNDARAAAVGETFYGKGRKYRDFVYIYFGVGVGGSIMNSGQPFRGSQGRAGEFGHMIVEAGESCARAAIAAASSNMRRWVRHCGRSSGGPTMPPRKKHSFGRSPIVTGV